MSTPIDLTQLPAPSVVEALDFETILASRKAHLVSLLPEAERAAVTALLELESEPATKLLEENAYQETILRNRVNEAGKAVMLAFSLDGDLDQLGANVNVARLTITPANPNALPPVAAVMEDNDAYRLRIQEAPDGLSVAGPKASYEFHARSSDGRVKDASATSPAPASVTVTVLANNDTGIAGADILAIVARALNAEDVRPLGDRLSVQAAQVIDYQIEATLYIGVGPEVPILLDAARANAARVSQPRRPLGHSIYRSACSAAVHVEGVRKVVLNSPAADIELNATQAARCTGINLNVVVLDE
ncbi:baseplate J-like protein [Janthinobacterium sp. HH103]|uniref:baseplate assembly protein n=1 Tax=unclassified Janthinobacterium TaxID=2610881 RepID=UPI000875094E|nr:MULTISPECIES: baseplate J/gp47 family protein [unclassified Janthinobacterium]OEZ70030.1 baseplate J-like protein [Janthinobacterium sp. HH100]OEZ70976.1 baseplate J-like protein [Janthinobacterium sp. HH103]QOU74292.1 Baseplate J-like protein [Janthinobacterium sp. HH102]